MNIILAHNDYDAAHLAEVKAEMQSMGAPTVKAVWMEGYGAYVALEGCHRLRAAHDLGLTPQVIEVDYSDEAADTDLECVTIAEHCDSAYRREMLEF